MLQFDSAGKCISRLVCINIQLVPRKYYSQLSYKWDNPWHIPLKHCIARRLHECVQLFILKGAKDSGHYELISYILVMQCFEVAYHGISGAADSYESQVFSGALVYTKKIQVTSGIFHCYTIPCHRKYSGQMRRLGLVHLNCTD